MVHKSTIFQQGNGGGVTQIIAGTNVTISPSGGTGAVTINSSGGGGDTPGGSNTQVQYNNSGAFGGITGATTDGTTLTLVAPILGTPASGTLTNCTFPTLNQNTSGQSGTVNTIASNISAGTNITFSGSGTLSSPYVISSTSTASTAFSAITGSTNTTAAMFVGTGASLATSGSGTIAATTVVTNANLTGDVTSVGNATTLTNAPVIAKVLTGYVSGAGTVAATDSILQAIQKLNGNTAALVTGVSSVFGRIGAVTAQTGDYTATQVGLGNVTNDAQTKAAIVPNTAPTAGQILVGNAGGTAYAPISVSGAFTIASTGAATIATPGTLTVASTNSTATAHTHAITSSSAPGAAASILATDASGIIGSTGTRIVKGWFTDLTVTNAISGSITGNAATVTTNANLTGVITSSGNVTSIASQTGTGTKFVVDTSPTLITPNIGTPSAGVLTNCTGLPAASIAGTLGVGNGGTGTGTAFTAGNVIFAGASGVYSQAPGTKLFWDNTNYRLGFNTNTPGYDIDIQSGAPNIRLFNANSAAGTYALLTNYTGGRTTLTAYSATGTAELDFDPVPSDGAGDSQFRFFRGVTTTGNPNFQIYKGDGSASINSLFSGNNNSYINALAGNVSIGTTTATSLFNVGSSAQFQINSSGNVVAGVWQGTAVTEVYGGTHQTSYTTGDILYASASNALSKLAIGTSGQVLKVTAGVPAWGTASGSGTVTSVSNTDGSITVTSGTTAAVISANAGSNIAIYGNGQDGSLSISSGTTTLTRDMFYTNLTISGTASINPNGFRIFVNGTLDLSNAPAGAIALNGAAGNAGAASGTTTGPVASPSLSAGPAPLGGLGTSATGSAGSTTTTAGTAGAVIQGVCFNGGVAGGAGASGASATGAAGTPGALITQAARLLYNFAQYPEVTFVDNGASSNIQLTKGGQSSQSGGGGAGDATAGASGGSGSQGGGTIFIFAQTIARGTNSNVGIIQAKGGAGGNGGSAAAGIRGGGGGAGGSGGGWVYIVYDTLTGSTITNAIDVTGGAGGAGGNGFGTGATGGDGGSSGSGGRVTYGVRTTGVITENTFSNVVAGNAHSGLTGGGAKTATTSRVDL